MSPETQADQPVADLLAGECLALRIRLLSRTVTGIYDEALRPLGVTAGQLNILVTVARRAPVSPGDIARRLNMEKSTMSRNIERMRRQGWLTVEPGGLGRQQALKLLPKGRRLLDQSLPLWKDAQRRTKGLLGQRGARSLHHAAEAVWSRVAR